MKINPHLELPVLIPDPIPWVECEIWHQHKKCQPSLKYCGIWVEHGQLQPGVSCTYQYPYLVSAYSAYGHIMCGAAGVNIDCEMTKEMFLHAYCMNAAFLCCISPVNIPLRNVFSSLSEIVKYVGKPTQWQVGGLLSVPVYVHNGLYSRTALSRPCQI